MLVSYIKPYNNVQYSVTVTTYFAFSVVISSSSTCSLSLASLANTPALARLKDFLFCLFTSGRHIPFWPRPNLLASARFFWSSARKPTSWKNNNAITQGNSFEVQFIFCLKDVHHPLYKSYIFILLDLFL